MNKATIAGIVTVVASLIVPETALGFKLPGKKDPKSPVDYTEWISIQELPAQEDGVTLFYPSTEPTDGAAVIKGTIPVKGLDARKVMLATLLYAVNNFDTEADEGLLSVDYDKNEFSAMLKST